MRELKSKPEHNACTLGRLQPLHWSLAERAKDVVKQAVTKLARKSRKQRKICARRRFENVESAQNAAYTLSIRINKHVLIAPCGHCNGYHLRVK